MTVGRGGVKTRDYNVDRTLLSICFAWFPSQVFFFFIKPINEQEEEEDVEEEEGGGRF